MKKNFYLILIYILHYFRIKTVHQFGLNLYYFKQEIKYYKQLNSYSMKKLIKHKIKPIHKYKDNKHIVITIENLRFTFILLLIGSIICVLVLIFEYCFYAIK